MEVKRNFDTFKKVLNDIAALEQKTTTKHYKGQKRFNERKTSEEIDEILLKDNELEVRALSRTYWNLSGLYRRLILYIATMLTYDILVTPKIIPNKNPEKNKILANLTNACYFIDSLAIESELPRIMTTMLIDGVYYGFFKDCGNNKFIFQDLDPSYCRSRYKTANGLPVLEFDLTYFLTIKGMEAITNVDELHLYPPFVVKAFNKYFNKVTRTSGGRAIIQRDKLEDGRWLIIPESLGVVFYYKDMRPLFVNTVEAIEDLNEYKGIEKALDKQELKKILIQKIPMDDQGELMFTLEEASELHKAVVKMLRNNPDVDVLTTMAELTVEDLQNTAQANRDNLEKMERSFYNEAGVSQNLFAAEGSVALEYSLKVDMALVCDIAKIFSKFLTYQINKKFIDKKFFLEVSILPITHYNREEMFDLYLKGAQYGYSKILAGVASGMKQSNLLNLITLENEYLKLAEQMVPLQSSHTTSGDVIKQEEGGAPKKTDKEKSDKTLANEESK